MRTIPALDLLGKEIRVGDKVVYAVKTREGGLQQGTVVEIIPYQEKRWIPNPMFTAGSGLDRGHYEDIYRMKLKVTYTQRKYNYTDREYYDVPTTKTLDTPSRFAIVD